MMEDKSGMIAAPFYFDGTVNVKWTITFCVRIPFNDAKKHPVNTIAKCDNLKETSSHNVTATPMITKITGGSIAQG